MSEEAGRWGSGSQGFAAQQGFFGAADYVQANNGDERYGRHDQAVLDQVLALLPSAHRSAQGQRAEPVRHC
jgi:hypothetical protein